MRNWTVHSTKDTPFGGFRAGSADLTCFLLSLIRLIKPNILLPATTALGSIEPDGRLKGILAGANVVMPNLSPVEVRSKYILYDNKLSTGSESAQNLEALKRSLASIGFSVAESRGDIKHLTERTESDRKERKQYGYLQSRIIISGGIHQS